MSEKPPPDRPDSIDAQLLRHGWHIEVEAHSVRCKIMPETEAHMRMHDPAEARAHDPAETEAHMRMHDPAEARAHDPAETEAHGFRHADPAEARAHDAAETEAHARMHDPAEARVHDPAETESHAHLVLTFPPDTPAQTFELRYQPPERPGGQPEIELHRRAH